MPNLSSFNFDESDLDERNRETSKKIQEDMRASHFETHFNHEFYFADAHFLPEQTTKKEKSKRSIQIRSLEKKRGSGSLIRRVASDRGKSK